MANAAHHRWISFEFVAPVLSEVITTNPAAQVVFRKAVQSVARRRHGQNTRTGAPAIRATQPRFEHQIELTHRKNLVTFHRDGGM